MRLVKLTIVFLWFSLAFLVFFSSIGEQVVVSRNLKEKINMVFPEGWGFFTKNPRDLLIEVYEIKGGQLNKVSLSNQTLDNFLGFSRRSRIAGYEASITANKIPKNEWKNSNSEAINSMVDTIPVVKFKAQRGFNFIKNGEYIFKLYKPIPFAWAKKKQEKNNPFTYARIKIYD